MNASTCTKTIMENSSKMRISINKKGAIDYCLLEAEIRKVGEQLLTINNPASNPGEISQLHQALFNLGKHPSIENNDAFKRKCFTIKCQEIPVGPCMRCNKVTVPSPACT